MAEQKIQPLSAHWKCMLACLFISMGHFQLGIDMSLISGMQAMVGFLKVFGHVDHRTPIGFNISPVVQSLITSLMTLGALVGSVAAGPISIFFGRRQCLWGACLLSTISNAIMMGSTEVAGLCVGRFLNGTSNGIFTTFSLLYLQEVAPARYRGLAMANFQIWPAVGSVIGTVVDNYTSKLFSKASYMIPLGIIYIIPATFAIGLFYVPESPRWLMQHGEVEKARKALQWLRPDPDVVEPEIREMKHAIEDDMGSMEGATMLDMFRNPVNRRRTLLALGIICIQPASGVTFILAYGTYFFEMAHVGHPFENACILNSSGVISILITVTVMVRYGRRRVFLATGLVICGFSMLIMAIVYQANPGTPETGKAIVALSFIYLFTHNLAIGPFLWLAGGEIPSQRLRSYTLGLALAVGYLGAWLITYSAPYFINPSDLNWGPKYGYIWFPSCIISAIFVFFCLPELKDRTLEEIDEMFEARLPARKFRGYQCILSGTVNEKTSPVDGVVFNTGDDTSTETVEKKPDDYSLEINEVVTH